MKPKTKTYYAIIHNEGKPEIYTINATIKYCEEDGWFTSKNDAIENELSRLDTEIHNLQLQKSEVEGLAK